MTGKVFKYYVTIMSFFFLEFLILKIKTSRDTKKIYNLFIYNVLLFLSN